MTNPPAGPPADPADQARSGSHSAPVTSGDPIHGLITVRYFAAARAAAGTKQERLAVDGPRSLEALAAILGHRHGPDLARVLGAASFLVDATAGPLGRTVQVGSVVDVLPPFAGG